MRYICTSCGKYSFSAAKSESGISDKCLKSGCDGKVVPSPEYKDIADEFQDAFEELTEFIGFMATDCANMPEPDIEPE